MATVCDYLHFFAGNLPSLTAYYGTGSIRTAPVRHGIWTPEIARAITSRWISEVPSKMV
jgi:hypothetical protein